MGCISSKVIARSISFHEKRKQGSQKKSNGIPLVEDIIISANSSDQYLALVCAANTVANKLRSKSFSSNAASKLAIEPLSSDTIDKLGISASQDQEGGKKIGIDQRKRSKSCHLFPEHILSSLSPENSSGFEGKYDLSSKGAVRSRSFHTVEEYDALVKRIWLPKSHRFQQCEFNDEDDGSETYIDLPVSESLSSTTHHAEDKDSAIKEPQPPCLHHKYSVEEISILSSAAESRKGTPSPESHIYSSGIKNKGIVPSHKLDVSEIAAQRGNTIEKGNKRKAVAKRLESLRIPSNIECPAIASLREWHPAGGIYSPGSYVTPKFGSYSLMTGSNAYESSEDSIFSPELVSAFENCMQKLEAEEEYILKQIMENLEEGNSGKMQSQERTPPCMEG